jgi:hypothetical protein
MKLALFAALFIGITLLAKAQATPEINTAAYLLEKSNKQYKAGMILLGGGTALLITSRIIPYNYDNYNNYNYENSNETIKSILGWTGAISMIISVPVFLSSGSNARLAARLGLQNQTIHQPIPIPGQPRNVPSLGLKIPL